MKSRTLTAIALALAFTVSACGGGIKVAPHLPDLKATSDKDVRASIMYVYGVLQATADELNSASKLEDDAVKSSPTAVPPNVDQAARKLFVQAATEIKTTTQAIDSKAITDWAQIQQHVNPIIDAVNDLAQLGKQSSGGGWQAIVGAAVNILMQLVQSGALSGLGHAAPPAPAPAL